MIFSLFEKSPNLNYNLTTSYQYVHELTIVKRIEDK